MLLYLLGVFLPPLAILLYGKLAHAGMNGILWTYAIITPGLVGLLMWIIAAFHATYIIREARSSRF